MTNQRTHILHKWLYGQRRPLRFFLVGLWNTFIGYAVYFCTLYGLQTKVPSMQKPYLWAITTAQIIGVINSYFGHRRLTFSDRRSPNRKMEFLRFFLVYLATLLMAFIVMPVLVENMHFRADVAGVINLTLSTLFSYTAHQRFTFRPSDN